MNKPLDLTVMMYHYIRDPGDEAEAGTGIFGMSVQAFEKQLDTLAQHHSFVAWPEVRQAIEEDTPLPRSACLLTFDDGICDHYVNVFRILHSRNLSGLFFALDRFTENGLTPAHKIHFLLAKLGVSALRAEILKKLDPAKRKKFTEAEIRHQLSFPSNLTEDRINLLKAVLQRDLSVEVNPLLSKLFEEHVGSETGTAQNYYLNMDQIHEMHAGGMHFGGHSQNHPWFDWVDTQTQNNEIQASEKWLRQVEVGPWAFAYPFGGFSSHSPSLLKTHGFDCAFTTVTQSRHSDQYFIGRLDGEEVAQANNGNVYG